MANESLRHDVLHLSDDDFGSKHGRDRTTKEIAARSANETAGYKAAEADAKKMEAFADKRSPESKAAAEKRMKEYKEGNAKSMEQFNTNMQKIGKEHDAKMEKAKQGSLFGDDTQTDPNKAEMDRRAAKDKEDKAAAREAKKAEKDVKGDAVKQASMISPKGNTTAAGRGTAGGGGARSGGGGGSSQSLIQKMNPLSKPYKAGGKVSSASKRADGCAIKGKTRGRMV